MNGEDRARATRAAQRAKTMQVRLEPLHSGREHDFSPVFGGEAVALAAELSRSAWTLAGHPLPTYTRATMPLRLLRRDPT
jgi:hypothetical protein